MEDFFMQDIYLSPHFDDIAFSLSSFIKPDSLIINVFTISNYIENLNYNSKNLSISEIRETEEQLFTSVNRLHFIKLDFHDRGMFANPFSFHYNVPNDDNLEQTLMHNIKSFIRTNERHTIYCPLGVGKHYNHLQVFNIIQRNYEELQKKFEIKFYAEAPYLSYKNNLNNRKRSLKQWFALHHIKEYKHKLHPAQVKRKIENLMCYASQFVDSSESIILSKLTKNESTMYEIIYC
jgi:hypothetical protein